MATSVKREVGGCRAGGGWCGAAGPGAERVRARVFFFLADVVAVPAGLVTQAQASPRYFDLHHASRLCFVHKVCAGVWVCGSFSLGDRGATAHTQHGEHAASFD